MYRVARHHRGCRDGQHGRGHLPLGNKAAVDRTARRDLRRSHERRPTALDLHPVKGADAAGALPRGSLGGIAHDQRIVGRRLAQDSLGTRDGDRLFLGRRGYAGRRQLDLDLVSHRFAENRVGHHQIKLVLVPAIVRPDLIDESERPASPRGQFLGFETTGADQDAFLPGTVAQDSLGAQGRALPDILHLHQGAHTLAPLHLAVAISGHVVDGLVAVRKQRVGFALDVESHLGAVGLERPLSGHFGPDDVGASKAALGRFHGQVVGLAAAGSDLAKDHLVLVEERVVAPQHRAQPVNRSGPYVLHRASDLDCAARLDLGLAGSRRQSHLDLAQPFVAWAAAPVHPQLFQCGRQALVLVGANLVKQRPARVHQILPPCRARLGEQVAGQRDGKIDAILLGLCGVALVVIK